MKTAQVTPLVLGMIFLKLESDEGLPEVVDGYFALPEGPGLGVTINEDAIREHPRQEIHFNLFKDDWHKRDAKRGRAMSTPFSSCHRA